MQRFRRKSEQAKATRRQSELQAASEDTNDVDSAPQLALPELSFRNSLILPHLTKRFSLLRDAQGNLLDIDTLETKLAAQRQTGMLTEDEANAVLAQFRLESQAQAAHMPVLPRTQRQRLDWSGVDLLQDQQDETLSSTVASARHSYASSNFLSAGTGGESVTSSRSPSMSWGRTSNVSAITVPPSRSQNTLAPSSSASSFVDARSEPSPSPGSTTTVAYKRSGSGGSSLFGGRVPSKAEMKMSRSSSSLASGSSSVKKSGSTPTFEDNSSSPLDQDQDQDTASSGHDGGNQSVDAVQTDSVDGLAETPTTATPHERPIARHSGTSEPPLTPMQMRRISRALDDIEADLSRTYTKILDDADDSFGDAADTEAIDPQFNQLSPVDDRSIATTSPLTNQVAPNEQSAVWAGSRDSVRLQRAAAVPVPPSPISNRTLDRSSMAHSLSLDLETPHSPRRRELSAASTIGTLSPMSPAAQTLRTFSSRSDLDQSFSDNDGPFDLSFGSTEHGTALREPEAQDPHPIGQVEEGVETLHDGEEEVEQPKALAAGHGHTRNVSTSTMSSTGSSYHAALEGHDSDADVATQEQDENSTRNQTQKVEGTESDAQPSALPSTSISPSADSSLLAIEAEPMSRRPSNELLDTINSSNASIGEADLALEDLMMIQETLVRAASRRAALAAARKKEGYDSSPYSEGAATSLSSRKGSLEASGSDGRRGSDGLVEPTGAGPRPSLEREEAGAGRRAVSPQRASRLTAFTTTTTGTGTSITESSPTNGMPTPSTQSDAFEFSSLVGSAEEEGWERGPRDSIRSRTELSNDTASPPGLRQSGAETGLGILAPDLNQELASEDEQEARAAVEASNALPALGDPVKLDADALRVPRNPLPARNKANTQSMLIRDVRNQATLATIALKKQGAPVSPIPGGTSGLRKSRSVRGIRKGSISSPQLVSGTSDIPTVPILNPDIVDPLSSPRARRDEAVTRNKSKSKGFGSRFKSLLRKTSRDQLPHLNGDEVTPFTETDMDASPPFTPPNQSMSSFGTPDISSAADNEAYRLAGLNSTPTGLAVVDEQSERSSPSIGSTSSGTSSNRVTRMLSRVTSGRSARERRESETTLHRSSTTTPEPMYSSASVMGTPLARQISSASTHYRQSSQEIETMGLGIASEDSSRAPISYDIGSRRRRLGDGDSSMTDSPGSNQTTPLMLSSHRQQSTDSNGIHAWSYPSAASTPTGPLSPSREGLSLTSPSRHERTESGASGVSVDSMQRLREAAEELGLPPDKVEELVNLSYAGSPTTSHAHSSSTGSTAGRRSEDGKTQASRHRSRPSQSSGSDTRRFEHRKGPSDGSSRHSAQGHVATPPPSAKEHRRQLSNGPAQDGAKASVPRVHPDLRIAVPASLAVDDKRLSLASRPPISPGAFSASSYRSSAYAGSVFDLYGSEGSETDGHRAEEDGDDGEAGQVVFASSPTGAGAELVEEADGSLVWKVVDDLRRHSAATASSGSIDFSSRPASLDSGGAGSANGGGTRDPAAQDPLAQLLRHHRRNMSMSGDGSRNPTLSLYVRDEQRLVELAREGGIADEADGHFFVRPKPEERVERGVDGEGERRAE